MAKKTFIVTVNAKSRLEICPGRDETKKCFPLSHESNIFLDIFFINFVPPSSLSIPICFMKYAKSRLEICPGRDETKKCFPLSHESNIFLDIFFINFVPPSSLSIPICFMKY